jgi:hypothetical protein
VVLEILGVMGLAGRMAWLERKLLLLPELLEL